MGNHKKLSFVSAIRGAANLSRKILPRKLFLTVVNSYMKAQKRRGIVRQFSLQYNLVDHCNLNCKCCSHYCPVAEPSQAKHEDFRRDLTRLKELGAERYLTSFALIGGEPLLHPEITEFVRSAREIFGSVKIQIHTNGVLLSQMPESFWQTLKDNNTDVMISRYPVDIHYEQIQNTASKYGVYVFYTYSPLNWRRFKYDMSCGEDAKKSFMKCDLAILCALLENGRICPCQLAQNAKILNARFGEVFKTRLSDSIDIYECADIDEIRRFIARPIPFCGYCTHEIEFIEWGLSQRALDEWLPGR